MFVLRMSQMLCDASLCLTFWYLVILQMLAVVTMGFVKDAKDHIDVQGFNVYHKNRLIKVVFQWFYVSRNPLNVQHKFHYFITILLSEESNVLNLFIRKLLTCFEKCVLVTAILANLEFCKQSGPRDYRYVFSNNVQRFFEFSIVHFRYVSYFLKAHLRSWL